MVGVVGDLEDDFLIDAGRRRQIAQARRAAGTDHEVVSYPGAAHAFWWPGTAELNQQARPDARSHPGSAR